MTISDHIAEIASWLSAAEIDTFELTGPDYRLYLRRGATEPSAALASAGTRSEIASAENAVHDLVASPGVGRFLHTHPVQEAPLVRTNEPVTTGQPLGLLQVGPILLPVVAPHDGIVAAILASDGSLVGYGDPLVALRMSP
jgi:acetyl-CoA carboxylase biotin carboxyl carrier protein